MVSSQPVAAGVASSLAETWAVRVAFGLMVFGMAGVVVYDLVEPVSASSPTGSKFADSSSVSENLVSDAVSEGGGAKSERRRPTLKRSSLMDSDKSGDPGTVAKQVEPDVKANVPEGVVESVEWSGPGIDRKSGHGLRGGRMAAMMGLRDSADGDPRGKQEWQRDTKSYERDKEDTEKNERLAKEMAEKDRNEQINREREKREQEKVDMDRREQEKRDQEKADAERREHEKREKEKADAERREHEKREQEKFDMDRREQEKREKEKVDMDKQEKAKNE